MNKGGQVFVKIPRHAAAASNSKGLYEEEFKSVIADGHKEFATRTKEHQRDGRTHELFNILALDLPFKATTQFNMKASATYCTSPWAGEGICLADQKLSVV